MDTLLSGTSYTTTEPNSNHMQFWMRLLILISLALYAFFLVDLVLNPLVPSDGPTLGNDRGVIFRYFALLAGAFSILVGMLVWRKSPGNLLGGLLIIWGTSGAGWGIRSEWSSPEAAGLAYQVFYTYFYGIGWQSIIAFIYLYPTGHFYPRKIKNLAVGLLFVQAVLGLAANLATPWFESTSSMGDIPNPVQIPWLQAIREPLSFMNNFGSIVAIGVPLVTLILRFRAASHQERQQIKWLVWLATSVAGLTTLILAVWPHSEAVNKLPLLTQIFAFLFLILFYSFPALASLIAIVRYRLWDIDILIRKTIVYSVLTGLLGLVYFSSVAMLQSFLSASRGQQTAGGGQPSPVIIVVTTLAIAALFNPLRKRIQDFIDRRFYRQKYDSEKALAEFAAVTRNQADLDQVLSKLAQTTQDTLQPQIKGIWIVKR